MFLIVCYYCLLFILLFFFFNDTATTEIYTLSLHDALPIFLDVVRRHEDRRAFAAQRVDQRPQLLPDLRIEPDRRLVEQHEPRPVDEGARDQQAPPHAAGELVDARVAPVDELRHAERALDRGPPFGA